MPVYPLDADYDGGADRAFALASFGFVTRFFRDAVLVDTTDWLSRNGYHVVAIDCATWMSDADGHAALAAALAFPDYYGANANALRDCLSDVAAHQYGTDTAATGTIVVLRHFDTALAGAPGVAEPLLDAFTAAARRGALFGHRMLCLVQTDSPTLRLPEISATTIPWNQAEWLDASRR